MNLGAARLLAERFKEFVSYEEISGSLGIGADDISGVLRELSLAGLDIEASGDGARLVEDRRPFSVEALKAYVKDLGVIPQIHMSAVLRSTNDTAKEMKKSKIEKIVIAESQTDGRGRFARSFYSPAETGLYISFLLKPGRLSSGWEFAAAAAAAAACRAIKRVFGIEAGIKWVNDIMLGERKIGGILAESGPGWVVLGIGVNISTTRFPPGIADIAGSLCPQGASPSGRTRLAAALIDEIISSSEWLDRRQALREYRSRLTMLGKLVAVERESGRENAVALSVDDEMRLVIRRVNGTIDVISTTEASIRVLKRKYT